MQAGEGEAPTFAQIYINDPQCDHPEEEAAVRLRHVRLPANTSVPVQLRLFKLLRQVMLRGVNPWIQDFIQATELHPAATFHDLNLVHCSEYLSANYLKYFYSSTLVFFGYVYLFVFMTFPEAT